MDWKRLERKSEEGLFLRGGAETIQICGGYMKVSIVDVSKEIFAGGDVPKIGFQLKRQRSIRFQFMQMQKKIMGCTDILT